jgi:hypothetical protein
LAVLEIFGFIARWRDWSSIASNFLIENPAQLDPGKID